MLDRDVRLSALQITYLQDCVRRRQRELRRKIDTAQKNRAAGQTIQHGTLDSHMRESSELALIAEALEVARKQIAHQITARLEHGR